MNINGQSPLKAIVKQTPQIWIVYIILIAVSFGMQQQFTTVISQTFCQNKSVLITYRVPKGNGNTATLWIPNETEDLLYKENQALGGEIMIQVKDLNREYELYTWSTKQIRHRFAFDLKNCTEGNSKSYTTLKTVFRTTESGKSLTYGKENNYWDSIIIGVTSFMCFLLIAIFTIPLIRKCKNPAQSSSNQFTPDEINLIQQPVTEEEVKLYIVFSEDSKEHVEVTETFAKYLQEDLGFQVILHLWEQQKVSKSWTDWLYKSIQEANKILVIWSPVANQTWERINSENTIENEDMFTPVIKQIQRDIFCGNNLKKYIFAYFSYCSESDIPQALLSHMSRSFLLMNDIESLYFLLCNKERYRPGGRLQAARASFENYDTTKNGPKLKTCIEACM
ncbi:unnamed protein product [Clavelina lepadiformis]|uniref:SEFIR domain-containing protein n=1 Tax=Clavelina lepadiformis TaxID=159417 RepID=A0ABP0H318_CLALP